MICKKCSNTIAMQAFCNSKCKVCETCAKKLNLCPQCGESIMTTCIVCNNNLTDSKDGICEICKHRADNYGYDR